MSNSPLPLQCSNPACLHPNNALGQQVCEQCQSPLIYSYLWTVGEEVAQIIAGMVVGERYVVMAPQIWLDTQPAQAPDVPPILPDSTLPYLSLYPQRLHVPEVQGFYQRGEGSTSVLLLKNAPIDSTGKLFPTLSGLWDKVPPVRQVYWFWQLLELWAPLQAQGVVSSLLVPENLRVEGWRVRLRELYADDPDATERPGLKDLAALWLNCMGQAESPVVPTLQTICQQMQTVEDTEAGWRSIATPLNQLLLEQAAKTPLRLKVISASSTGPKRAHNEDACYPPPVNAQLVGEALTPQLAIVCDGIGGHEGGEVASQLAVRSLQLQIRALLAEATEQTEPMTPEVVTQQLEALIRVVNNLIANQNDTQGREARQRMGTTLMMALQLPQQVTPPAAASGNGHELYLAHVGDSRAYWLTPRYCLRLTVDDDVAAREVKMARSLYDDALKRVDAGALTQALGTRDADFLHPTIQRFIIEEDGMLLLCSDGLSDNNLVEQNWEDLTRQVFKGKLSLEAAVQSWVELANQRNGHDNTSVVLLHFEVSPEHPQLFAPSALPGAGDRPTPELTEASKALLYGESDPSAPTTTQPKSPQPVSPWAIRVGLAVLLLIAGAAGIVAWQRLDPTGFDRTWERILRPNSPAPNSAPPSPNP
jgi:protein phosphatase